MAAKETMIVFVYDTECLQHEADDPVNAVLYFHPSWVSDTQKVALCGQLMGTSYFLKDCFFKPRILALQNGKFILKEFGRFILAVGTDRNISDCLLEQRANMLASLVRLYHRDLQTIHDQCAILNGGGGSSGNVDGPQQQQLQHKNLTEKLYHIFETYLPILQQKGNIFHNVPKLRMPKTASNIFLDAIQTLQCCQQTRGVLGGAILYHNKVVATQLSDGVTKQLVLTDPLHIRSTAEQLQLAAATSDFHIPNGVQLLAIYLELSEYRRLSADAQRAQQLQTQPLAFGGTNGLNAASNGGAALPFQYAKRKMKRDKSLIFTNIPEEGGGLKETAAAPATLEQNNKESSSLSMTKPTTLNNRPKSLALRHRNMSAKELPESGIASINFDENDSYPEFIGRTSVCSTPMTENKLLQVGNIMSICAATQPPDNDDNSNGDADNNQQKSKKKLMRNSIKIDFDKFFQHFLTQPKALERRNSLNDLQDSLRKISKKLKLSKNSFKTDENRNGDDFEILQKNIVDADADDDIADKTSRTISDPSNPLFNANGQPMSRALFQELLERYYSCCDVADAAQKDAEIAQLIKQFKEFDQELQQLQETLSTTATSATTLGGFKADRNLNIAAVTTQKPQKTTLDKLSLSLPLKPISDAATNNAAATVAPMSFGSQRKQPGAIPLTPLMAKLSVLAACEEQRSTSGFCSWDTTPGVGGGIVSGFDLQTPLDGSARFVRRRSSSNSLKCDEAIDALDAQNYAQQLAAGGTALAVTGTAADGLQRAELYVCGQQNMTLLLLLEQGACSKQQIVQNMFEICVAKFPHMESHLHQTLNINVEGDKSEGGYSFVCIDDKWESLQRCGPWNPVELNTLESMHRDMQTSNEITDMILRASDSVYYGYKSGRSEYFYKEPAHQATGIPPPSDPMGNVAMRAKTRLERDHSYMLF